MKGQSVSLLCRAQLRARILLQEVAEERRLSTRATLFHWIQHTTQILDVSHHGNLSFFVVICMCYPVVVHFNTPCCDDLTCLLTSKAKAQTESTSTHWTPLLRAFPSHGSGARISLSERDGNLVGEPDGMTESLDTRMQHDVGTDFKVPLPMFSGMRTGRYG